MPGKLMRKFTQQKIDFKINHGQGFDPAAFFITLPSELFGL